MGVTVQGLAGLLVTVQEAISCGLKPLPVIVTDVPDLARLGLTVIVGANCSTTKTAVAKSPVLPATLMVCAPNVAVLRTINVAEVILPFERVHVAKVTISGNGVLVTNNAQAARSAGLNPLPVIVTPVPAVPEPGVSVIEGANGTTVNVA